MSPIFTFFHNLEIKMQSASEMTKYNISVFELKMTGFADNQKDTKIVFGAYVAVTDDEETAYSYIQIGTPKENEKYYAASYNDIVNNS